jgi:hypothetical protein
MVHRTDIAVALRGRQALAMTACGAVHQIAPFSKTILRPNPASRSGGKDCCRLLTRAVPPVAAIYLELLAYEA